MNQHLIEERARLLKVQELTEQKRQELIQRKEADIAAKLKNMDAKAQKKKKAKKWTAKDEQLGSSS